MADILCPHCNMPNPDDQNICSFCRQPLHIASDDEAIRPGDMPTKKTTAELEPILPQWLRDARTMARESAEEDEAEQAAAAAKPAAETPGPADWLAGLEAAAREEENEDVPDWMRSMAPSKPAPATPKPETPAPPKEITLTKRHEISWDDEPTPAPRASEPPPTGPLGAIRSEDGIPYWLKNMNAEEPAEEKKEVSDFLAKQEQEPPQGNASPFQSGTFRPSTGELINWLDKMSPQVGEAAPSMPSADVPASEPLPDWISKLESEPAVEASSPTDSDFNFDWLKEESSKPFAPFQGSQIPQDLPPAEAAEEPEATELPDWMKPSEETNQAPLSFASLEPAAETPAPAAAQEEVPDWLANMAAQTAEPAAANEAPDWLSSLPAAPQSEPVQEEPASSVPDWMQTFASESAGAIAAAPATEESLPDWIKPAMETPAPQAEEAPTLDWIQPSAITSPAAEEKPSALPSVPAFITNEDQNNDLFAVDMPDWLSSIAPAEMKSATANLPKAETPKTDSIAPAELPSWVQAMRPVEAALPGTPATQEPISRPAEVDGPLAGLRGVLPDMPGVNVAGKPRIYSIRLEPNADQQQHAAMLEKMIEAETQAKPMRGTSFLLGAQRVLRWVITGILVLLVTLVLFGRTQLTPLPIFLNPETSLALQAVNTVPQDAPVLLVFDYEPALAGELEAAAASLLDYLTVARNPNYSVLSTSPTGAALAERFLPRSGLIARERVINLGYLPGESTGILSFAMNPHAAKPLAKNVNAYSDYALVILLTDRAESARAWVEQTSAYDNGRPLVVISSAQAAPMIQPYLISGQVNGLVSGLHGGAELEDELSLPGSARVYWDAYNFAMIAVVVMIFIGAVWNLVLGLRARRQEQADA